MLIYKLVYEVVCYEKKLYLSMSYVKNIIITFYFNIEIAHKLC